MPYIKHTSKKFVYNKITKTWCKQFIEFVTNFLIQNMNVPFYLSEEFSEIEQYYKRSEKHEKRVEVINATIWNGMVL